jgi:hypothetical protein
VQDVLQEHGQEESRSQNLDKTIAKRISGLGFDLIIKLNPSNLTLKPSVFVIYYSFSIHNLLENSLALKRPGFLFFHRAKAQPSQLRACSEQS